MGSLRGTVSSAITNPVRSSSAHEESGNHPGYLDYTNSPAQLSCHPEHRRRRICDAGVEEPAESEAEGPLPLRFALIDCHHESAHAGEGSAVLYGSPQCGCPILSPVV